MVYLDEDKAVCRILDQHPNTTQKRLTFLVSPTSTAQQFLDQVSTQFTYDKFDLIIEISKVSSSHMTFEMLLIEFSIFRF